MSEFVVKCGHPENVDGECSRVFEGIPFFKKCDSIDHPATDAARVAVCEAAKEVLPTIIEVDGPGEPLDRLATALSVFKEE